MNKFKILYTDGTEFEGDPFGGGWNQINVTKQIAKLEYVLGNSCIIMEGFKQYNHFKERLGLQVKGYSKVILMGRTDGNTLLIIFDLLKKKIYHIEKPCGEEYGKQILAGWIDGLLTTPEAFVNGEKIYPTVEFKKIEKTDVH